MATTMQRRVMRLKIAGTALFLLALLMFVGSFVAAARTPMGRDLTGCQKGVPCDPSADPSHRQNVFFLWMGATLIVLAGGMSLRAAANHES